MNRREILTGGAWATICGPTTLASAKSASTGAYASRIQRIEAMATRRLASARIPGATLGFSQGGFTWVRGFGQADLENRIPATADTAYRYASLQKSMTATAVLQLVEAGRLDLEGEIQTYVPYYPMKPFPITVRQLLGHLGGIPHYVNRAVEQHFTDQKTTRQAVEVFAAFDLVAEPGTKFVYSTYGYNLLGAAIEEVSGQPYAQYMRKQVWDRAGMASARMDDPLELIPNRSRGYQRIADRIMNSEFINLSSRFAAGGTRGTVPDLLRFTNALNAGKLIGAESLKLMYSEMRTRDGGFSGIGGKGYAMGWNILGNGVIHNDGGQQETRTTLINVPSEDLVIAYAQNAEFEIDGPPLAFGCYEILTGRPFPFQAR